MNGIINLLKPPGMTSHDCITFTRKLFNIRQVGHMGTLDPAAAGVLPIFLGNTTRLIEYYPNDKEYVCEIIFGVCTDSGDDTGKVLKTANFSKVCDKSLNIVLENLRGNIKQRPPVYSAVKIKGKKLYQYARKEQEVSIPEREVIIYNSKLLSIQDNKARFFIHCSSGTYIRTLCQQIGEKLGGLGTMSFLVRTKLGIFSLTNSISLEELITLEKNAIIDFTKILPPLEKMIISDDKAKVFTNGQPIKIDNKNGLFLVFDNLGSFLGIGLIFNNLLKAKKVIYRDY